MNHRIISTLIALCLLFFCLPVTVMAEHSCMDETGDFRCDTCGAWMEHTCIDKDGDWY